MTTHLAAQVHIVLGTKKKKSVNVGYIALTEGTTTTLANLMNLIFLFPTLTIY